jgi:hypothetical protein
LAAVSIVGGLETASGFDGLINLFVKWRLVASPENWRLTHGDDNGTTWVSERNEVRRVVRDVPSVPTRAPHISGVFHL